MTFSSCAQTVRKHDPDRFLLSLFMPAECREALFALYAFNYEIARTREVVTETQLGLIRLQWWRDALKDIYIGKPPLKNPVLEALHTAIEKYNLPQELFESLIYAREFDLEDRPPANLDGMVKYAEFTATPLLQLALLVCHSERHSPEESPKNIKGRSFAGTQDDRVKNIAISYALTGLLRAVPFHLSQRRCYLPADQIPFIEELYEGKGLERLKEVVRSVVIPAKAGIRTSYELDPVSQRGDKLVLLHAKLAQMYLKQIERAGYDVFHPRLQVPPFLKELRLYWAIF